MLRIEPDDLPGVEADTPAFKFGGIESPQISLEGKDEIDVPVTGIRAGDESRPEEPIRPEQELLDIRSVRIGYQYGDCFPV